MKTDWISGLPKWARICLSVFYQKIAEANYRVGVLAPEKKVNSVSYRTYDPIMTQGHDSMLSEIISEISPTDVVYDVGAHVGNYSLAIAASGADRVVSFEPNPAVVRQLRKNIDANEFENVEVVHAAVSDTCGEVGLLVPRDRSHASINEVIATAGGSVPTQKKVVDAETIDSYVEQKKAPPNIIKIDAEGHGLAVLNGSARTLDKHKPKIFFELHTGVGYTIDDSRLFINVFRVNESVAVRVGENQPSHSVS